jgi:segregation and condensation protein A
MMQTNIQVKTEQFDGPLSLLLLLIQKEEMDIRSLNITLITRQYLNYLETMKELNFDIAGEYLYLATSLLFIKSKECLNEDDLNTFIDPTAELAFTSEAELIHRLEELIRYQKLSTKLASLPRLGSEIFTHPKANKKAIINSILTPMSLQSLTQCYIELISKNNRQYTLIKRDKLSIKEKLVFLKEKLTINETIEFELLLSEGRNSSIDETVITFISLLELARLQKINIYQNEYESTIYIHVKSSLESFDVDLATGFEMEEELPTSTEYIQ